MSLLLTDLLCCIKGCSEGESGSMNQNPKGSSWPGVRPLLNTNFYNISYQSFDFWYIIYLLAWACDSTNNIHDAISINGPILVTYHTIPAHLYTQDILILGKYQDLGWQVHQEVVHLSIKTINIDWECLHIFKCTDENRFYRNTGNWRKLNGRLTHILLQGQVQWGCWIKYSKTFSP